MTHAPHSPSPEHGPVSTAAFSESDESFLRWFEEDTELNNFANARAAAICIQWNEMLAETNQGQITDQENTFHFEVKKWLFLFTNPENHTDTPDDRELGIFFTSIYMVAGKNADNVLPTLNRLAARADTTDIDRLAQGPILTWNLLSYREKFWMVQGLIFGHDDGAQPNIPPQSRRS